MRDRCRTVCPSHLWLILCFRPESTYTCAHLPSSPGGLALCQSSSITDSAPAASRRQARKKQTKQACTSLKGAKSTKTPSSAYPVFLLVIIMGAHLLHYLILLLLGLGFAVATAELSPPGWNHTILTLGLSLARAEKFANPASDRQTSQFARLRNVRGPVGRNFPVASVAPKSPLTQASSSTASTSKKTATVSRSSPFQNISAVNAFSTQYAIDCSWDGAPVSLIFDTGSADTWVAGLDLSCQDHAGHTHDRATCGFGGPSVDGFSHGAIDNVHFSLRYGSGETVSGPMGYSDISCGGLSVSHQQVGLANQTHWRGDNITAGILGLAQPSLTSAFYGPVGDEAPRNSAAYSTFIATAISQGSMDPMFSVAILKDSAGGVLAWGGLPPIAYDHTKMAAVDLLIVSQGRSWVWR